MTTALYKIGNTSVRLGLGMQAEWGLRLKGEGERRTTSYVGHAAANDESAMGDIIPGVRTHYC